LRRDKEGLKCRGEKKTELREEYSRDLNATDLCPPPIMPFDTEVTLNG
jgi:hypothetical protein